MNEIPAIAAWTKVRDTILTVISLASGVDEEHVIWSDENANAPEGTYIDLSVSGSENPGQDEVIASTDMNRPEGQEVKLEVKGQREVNLQVEVFTNSTVTGKDSGADALALVEQLRSSLALPDFGDRLARGSVVFIDISAPGQYVPFIVRAGFRGRAIWNIRAVVPAIAARQFTTYIEHVRGTITNPQPVGGPVETTYEVP